MKKLIALLAVIFLFIPLTGCSTMFDLYKETEITYSDETITLEEFNKIEHGMTYSQVCEIIGGKGTLSSSVDLGMGAEYVTEMYDWEGKGKFGGNASITFQGGVVTAKAQFGLE